MIVGIVHYLADLPRCWGDCGQGRARCASPDLCAGANAAMTDAARECRRQLRAEPELMGARMGMACAATTQPADLAPLRAWPWAEHSRPGKLTEAELIQHNKERDVAYHGICKVNCGGTGCPAPTVYRNPEPAIFGQAGAVLYRPAPTWLERLRTAWLSFRIRRLGRL